MTSKMKESVYHFDKGKVERYEITTHGFLKLYGTVVREGYLEYHTINGIEKEYVPLSTLFEHDHVETTNTSPITLNHPPNKDFLNPKTFRKYSIGNVKKVIKNKGDKQLDIELLICDEKGIEAIKNGITALSMGYKCDREQTGPNEFIQTKRWCNHIAVCKKGRAKGAEIHLDSMERDLIDFYKSEPEIETEAKLKNWVTLAEIPCHYIELAK